jgi:hypothetical protein
MLAPDPATAAELHARAALARDDPDAAVNLLHQISATHAAASSPVSRSALVISAWISFIACVSPYRAVSPGWIGTTGARVSLMAFFLQMRRRGRFPAPLGGEETGNRPERESTGTRRG